MSIEKQSNEFAYASNELADQVNDLWRRADKLGMLNNNIVFDIPTEDNGSIRVYGGLQKLPGSNKSPVLRVALNRVDEYENNTGEGWANVFSDNYLVGPSSISSEAGFVTFEEVEVFELNNKDLPAIIWQDAEDDWHLLRGEQKITYPKLPGRGELEGRIAAARFLKETLCGLTPGNEDARYTLE